MKAATTGTSIPRPLDAPEPESKLDAQHPWPGLEGYEEGDQPFFRGRSEEIEDLYRLIRRERLTLLVGKPGTGKSSLIRAGVFPKQRAEEALPVYVRLDCSEDAPALGTQVKHAVYEAARAWGLEAPAPTDNQSLWEYLHLHDGEFWSRHHRIIMPFIVFDQFEELFTLGLAQHDSPRPADVRAFFSELSDLAEERVPVAVLEDPARMDRHNLNRHHYKLLVCIREEYVAELDRMRDQLPPALFQNQMRLTEMTAERAKQVVLETGAEVGADALADEIVERASKGTSELKRDTEVGHSKSCVSPALLSVLCTTLNQKRLDDGAPRITQAYLDDLGPSILKALYEKQLESLPEVPGERPWDSPRTRARKVNDRIAQEFVDGDVRVSIPESRARTVFGDAALEKLLLDKVLDRNPHGRIELIHDVLAPEVTKTTGRFLRELARTLRDVAVALIVAALVLIPAAALIGYERGKNQTEPSPPPEPFIGPTSRPPFNPSGPERAVAIAQGILKDLNDGTREVDASVDYLAAGDLGAALRSLARLDVFLFDARPFFCDSEAASGSWHEAQMNQVLDQACSAAEIQERQWQTLSSLARDLIRTGDGVRFDTERRSSVVGAWDGYEDTFNTAAASINAIITRWTDELGADP